MMTKQTTVCVPLIKYMSTCRTFVNIITYIDRYYKLYSLLSERTTFVKKVCCDHLVNAIRKRRL